MDEKDKLKVLLTGIVNKVADKLDVKLSGKTVENQVSVNIENITVVFPSSQQSVDTEKVEEIVRQTVKQLTPQRGALLAQPANEQVRILTETTAANATAVFQRQVGGAIQPSGKATPQVTSQGEGASVASGSIGRHQCERCGKEWEDPPGKMIFSNLCPDCLSTGGAGTQSARSTGPLTGSGGAGPSGKNSPQ